MINRAAILLGLFCALFAGAGPALAAPAETVLYTFNTQVDGLAPIGSLVPDGAGGFYIATDAGGSASCAGLNATLGCGAIVKLSPPKAAGAGWTETVLHSFSGTDGTGPLDLVADSVGNLYTPTQSGSRGQCYNGSGCGTFVELSPPAAGTSRWTETVLYRPGNGWTGPGNVIADRKGNLYATMKRGGAFYRGAVVKLSPPAAAKSSWTQTVLFSFKGGADGSQPAALIWGRAGSLYLTTAVGGATGRGAG